MALSRSSYLLPNFRECRSRRELPIPLSQRLLVHKGQQKQLISILSKILGGPSPRSYRNICFFHRISEGRILHRGSQDAFPREDTSRIRGQNRSRLLLEYGVISLPCLHSRGGRTCMLVARGMERRKEEISSWPHRDRGGRVLGK